MTMEKWAAEELRYVDLGDKRRKKRLIKIVENLALQPGASIPQASKNMASTTATYDFFSSPYFQPSQIIEAQAKSARDRMKKGEIVLAIQDTTNLDFTTQKAKKRNGLFGCQNILRIKSAHNFIRE